MHYFGRVAGVATLALSAVALSACYVPTPPPPPAAAVAPGETLAPVIGSAAPYEVPAPAYPQYGSTTPLTPAPSYAGTAAVVAPYAPPAPRIETPPPPSSPLAVWESGHWSWNGAQFVWIAGHYVMRPSATATWHPGYWQQGPGGWSWIEGSWG